MKSKQHGSVSVLIITIVFFFILLVYMCSSSLSLQEVEELDQRCKQAHGETLLATTKSGKVKYAQCKKDGAIYSKF